MDTSRIIFIVVYWVFFFLVFVVKNIMVKAIRKKRNNTTINFLNSMLSVVILTIALYGFLSQFEATKNMSTTILQSSSLIIALMTFACQKVLGNIVSGIVISSVKPFDIGQKIILMQGNSKVAEGYVIGINLRHTTIQTIDGKYIMVPNSVLDEMIVINVNKSENKGHPLEMECSLNSDVDLAIDIMKQEIKNNPLTVKNISAASNVMCSGFTANGFILKAVVWTNSIDDSFLACSQLRLSIFKAWKEAGIEIPYQTITIDK